MQIEKAKEFILLNARPLELAVYRYFFEGGSNKKIVEELAKYQNADGGFGHGLEPDNWNPNSNPIATNDAIIILYRADALDEARDMVNGIVRYLKSHDSFDEEEKCWLFAIESNKDYPHAIWWEKNGNGISGFNPTVSLATFMLCYGERTPYYEDIVRKAVSHLKENEDISGDALKCYLLSYGLFQRNGLSDIVDLEEMKQLISKRIEEAICKDTEKYGIEYVPVPSDFFAGANKEFITDDIQKLINVEKEILGTLQKDDGGFDISWEWYTAYPEFNEARKWWRPRITIDKLLFY